jgi:hypothetical protein
MKATATNPDDTVLVLAIPRATADVLDYLADRAGIELSAFLPVFIAHAALREVREAKKLHDERYKAAQARADDAADRIGSFEARRCVVEDGPDVPLDLRWLLLLSAASVAVVVALAALALWL